MVSPHRAQRPWQGQTERAAGPAAPTYDPNCYLCPGNKRAHGDVNPHYAHTFVFDNDFPALMQDAGSSAVDRAGLLVAEPETGVCRVICFSPRHDLTLARMSVEEIEQVITVWAEETRALGARDDIRSVQIFENRGAMMGASNPHPHCQIWASEHLPNEIAKELRAQTDYWQAHGTTLLGDYLTLERESGERIVYENDHVTVLVPFWAIWPFETMIVTRRAVGAIGDLTAEEARGLAEALSALTIRYDNLFETSFPYSMGFHQRPSDGGDHPGWHLHAHFYPPLLRSATVRKFMVGFELLGMPQRDITPEAAAERLRALPQRHYLDTDA